VIPVVIDASAGVELLVDTTRGRALRALFPTSAVPWVPDLFYAEVGSVLRRWDLAGVLTPTQVSEAIEQLAAWPLRSARLRPLFGPAWRYRHNLTFTDAMYVALAERLEAPLLTDDQKLANAPGLPVTVLRLDDRAQ
jgi:predicted nucleic acid-binding protein